MLFFACAGLPSAANTCAYFLTFHKTVMPKLFFLRVVFRYSKAGGEYASSSGCADDAGQNLGSLA